jgi:anti-anti-sigma factor
MSAELTAVPHTCMGPAPARIKQAPFGGLQTWRDKNMNIQKTTDGNAMTMSVEGWLDTQAAQQFQDDVAAIPDNVESLDLDLAKLEYISSSGLRQVVAAYKKVKGNLVIKNVSKEILDVFHMTGFDKKLKIES